MDSGRSSLGQEPLGTGSSKDVEVYVAEMEIAVRLGRFACGHTAAATAITSQRTGQERDAGTGRAFTFHSSKQRIGKLLCIHFSPQNL